MHRREAVRNMALLMGGAISATTMSFILGGCNTGNTTGKDLLDANRQAMIDEIAELIIPATTTPGAKAAAVGPFIVMMLNECFPQSERELFVKGLDHANEISEAQFSKPFMDASATQRNQVMTRLAAEATEFLEKEKDKKKEDQSKTPPFFKLMKELTMLGYFTSEIGATKALVYLPIPGRYDGCADLKPGEKAFSL